MRILAVAPNSRTTAELERALIAMFHRSPFCANVGVGGEAASFVSPHSLYFVFREDSLAMRGPLEADGGPAFHATGSKPLGKAWVHPCGADAGSLREVPGIPGIVCLC